MPLFRIPPVASYRHQLVTLIFVHLEATRVEVAMAPRFGVVLAKIGTSITVTVLEYPLSHFPSFQRTFAIRDLRQQF